MPYNHNERFPWASNKGYWKLRDILTLVLRQCSDTDRDREWHEFGIRSLVLDWIACRPILVPDEQQHERPTIDEVRKVLNMYPDRFKRFRFLDWGTFWTLTEHFFHNLPPRNPDDYATSEFWVSTEGRGVLRSNIKDILQDRRHPIATSDIVELVRYRLWNIPVKLRDQTHNRMGDVPLLPEHTQVEDTLDIEPCFGALEVEAGSRHWRLIDPQQRNKRKHR